MRRILLIFPLMIIGYFCAKRKDSRIFNADAVTISTVPYMVSLLMRTDEPFTKIDDWSFLCSGAIIHQYAVLTSGSCIARLKENEIEKKDILIRGNTETWACSCGRTKEHTIIGYVLHEKFSKVSRPFQPTIYRNDIGIVTVQEGFTGLYEIPYSYTYNWSDTIRYAAGWGFSYEENRVSDTLQMTFFKTDDRDKCQKSYKTKLPPEAFCIRKYEKVNGILGRVCEYDTGGSILDIVDKVIIGIVSTGGNCGGHPAICTNVTKYIAWIDKAISDSLYPHTSNWW